MNKTNWKNPQLIMYSEEDDQKCQQQKPAALINPTPLSAKHSQIIAAITSQFNEYPEKHIKTIFRQVAESFGYRPGVVANIYYWHHRTCDTVAIDYNDTQKEPAKSQISLKWRPVFAYIDRARNSTTLTMMEICKEASIIYGFSSNYIVNMYYKSPHSKRPHRTKVKKPTPPTPRERWAEIVEAVREEIDKSPRKTLISIFAEVAERYNLKPRAVNTAFYRYHPGKSFRRLDRLDQELICHEILAAQETTHKPLTKICEELARIHNCSASTIYKIHYKRKLTTSHTSVFANLKLSHLPSNC